MPRRDRSGPVGFGPGTGKGAGGCVEPVVVPWKERMGNGGSSHPYGKRFGRNAAAGIRRQERRHGAQADIAPQDARDILERHKKALEGLLDMVNAKLDELTALDAEER